MRQQWLAALLGFALLSRAEAGGTRQTSASSAAQAAPTAPALIQFSAADGGAGFVRSRLDVLNKSSLLYAPAARVTCAQGAGQAAAVTAVVESTTRNDEVISPPLPVLAQPAQESTPPNGAVQAANDLEVKLGKEPDAGKVFLGFYDRARDISYGPAAVFGARTGRGLGLSRRAAAALAAPIIVVASPSTAHASDLPDFLQEFSSPLLVLILAIGAIVIMRLINGLARRIREAERRYEAHMFPAPDPDEEDERSAAQIVQQVIARTSLATELVQSVLSGLAQSEEFQKHVPVMEKLQKTRAHLSGSYWTEPGEKPSYMILRPQGTISYRNSKPTFDVNPVAEKIAEPTRRFLAGLDIARSYWIDVPRGARLSSSDFSPLSYAQEFAADREIIRRDIDAHFPYFFLRYPALKAVFGKQLKPKPRTAASGSAPRCPYCHMDIAEPDQSNLVACSKCGTAHHAECWSENKGCTLLGCGGKNAEQERPRERA